jgi:hypothetical protein
MSAKRNISDTFALLLRLDGRFVNTFQSNADYFNAHQKIFRVWQRVLNPTIIEIQQTDIFKTDYVLRSMIDFGEGESSIKHSLFSLI